MKRFWIRLMAALPLGDATVLIENDKAVRRRGKLPATLLSELSDVAASNGVRHACLHERGTRGTGFRLRLFGVPADLRQRFRNVWGANRR